MHRAEPTFFMGIMGFAMHFDLKNETVTFDDGATFVVNEPTAADVVDMNADGVKPLLYLIGRCVSRDGTVLGDDAGRMPARYLERLSEVVSRLGGLSQGNG